MSRLEVVTTPGGMGLCKLLLQEGFWLRAAAGASLGDFLRGGLGLEASYVDGRVRTVFADGHPVDDLEAHTVHEGEVIGLSGALPGVVGIAMRRDSPLARMRAGISLQDDAPSGLGGEVLVRLKLFNLILNDLGPLFLSRGLGLEPGRLASFLQNLDAVACMRSLRLDGEELPPAAAAARLAACTDQTVWLVCTAQEEG